MIYCIGKTGTERKAGEKRHNGNEGNFRILRNISIGLLLLQVQLVNLISILYIRTKSLFILLTQKQGSIRYT